MEEDLKKPAQTQAEPPAEEAKAKPLPEEREENAPSFQELIRGRYREEYLRHAAGLLQAQARQTNRYLAYRALRESAERLREKHPDFELTKELENPAFARLVENGVALETAWEVVHRDDLAKAAAARQIAEARPQENGLGRSAAPAVFHADPRSLTRQERKALRRRAARGEEIVW